MKKGVNHLATFLVIVIILLIGVTSSAEEINRCAVLDKKDSVYILSGDLTSSKNETCIKVTAENITLDCINHSISSAANQASVAIFSNKANTTIQNCNIQNFEKGTGIKLENSPGSKIINNTLTRNKFGIEIVSNSIVMAHNSISLNQYGIKINGKGNIINNNLACFNVINDLSCDNQQIFENNYCDSLSACGNNCIPCTHNIFIVSKCLDLNLSDSTYFLGEDIITYLPGACFRISAEKITLDCLGHKIMYSLKSLPKVDDFLVYSNQNYSTIKNCNFEGDGNIAYNENAIKLENGYQASILNNSFRYIGDGISLYVKCLACEIKGNRFNVLQGSAIKADALFDSIIKENKIVSTSKNAITISGGQGMVISKNYIEDSKKDAINIKNDAMLIENNEIKSIMENAISLESSNSSYVKSNTLKNINNYGIYLNNSQYAIVQDNDIRTTKGGIFVENLDNSGIIGNNVGDSSFGFKELNSSKLKISKNIFCGNEKDVICESKSEFLENNCNSRDTCQGKCIACGIKSSSGNTLWSKIKIFFWGLL